MRRESFPYLCLVFTSVADRSIPDDELFLLLQPTQTELMEHVKEGYFVGSWGVHRTNERLNAPTDLRQNIVLFMAAMNGEL